MGASRNRKQLGVLVASCVLVVVTASCATEHKPTPTPTTADTESANLAAAIDAFTVFNAVLDGYSAHTKPVSNFKPLVTPEYFDVLVAEDAARDTTTWTEGASSFGDEKLVDPAEWGGYGDLSLVVCLDISRTKVVDTGGELASPPPRQTRVPLIVYFNRVPDERDLLVSKVDQWNESGYCSQGQ